MDNLNLVSTFAEFKELKNIDKSTMIGVLEDVFRHLLIKTYETDENFDVIINPEKGDLEIWRNRTIVEDGTVENPNQQISLTDARKIDSTYEVGEEVAEEIKLADFGRPIALDDRAVAPYFEVPFLGIDDHVEVLVRFVGLDQQMTKNVLENADHRALVGF